MEFNSTATYANRYDLDEIDVLIYEADRKKNNDYDIVKKFTENMNCTGKFHIVCTSKNRTAK